MAIFAFNSASCFTALLGYDSLYFLETGKLELLRQCLGVGISILVSGGSVLVSGK